jgi:GT2 family glycosyltransferase
MTTPAGGPVQVSIITPCYNGARFVRQTLQSAIAQTRPPLEIIVIDDGSTDESAAIAESLGPPVRVLRQENRGESVARNRGLAEARGSHVLFLDADDILAPEALAHLAGALDSRPGAIAIMGCGFFTDDPEALQASNDNHYTRFLPEILSTNFGPPLCWLAPVEVIRRVGGFAEDLRWFEDWDLWWRVGMLEPDLVPVNYVGARYRQHAQSQLATTSLPNRTRGHAALTSRMAAAFLGNPSLLARHGEAVFWSAWTSWTRALSAGVPVSELTPLSDALRGLAAAAPPPVARSTTARLIRWLGPGLAARLR